MLNHPIRLFQILINKTKGLVMAKGKKDKKERDPKRGPDVILNNPKRGKQREDATKIAAQDGQGSVSISLSCVNGEIKQNTINSIQAFVIGLNQIDGVGAELE